jgi:formylglycine-generating enzyme required for sulfatase activity
VFRGGSWLDSATYCRVAYRNSYNPSDSYYGLGFRLARSIETPVVADPVISPAGGSFEEAQTVSITSETTDANIYYTLDGSAPTEGSTLYTEAFELAETSTVKAIAYKDGWDDSAIVTVEYVINIPVLAPEGFVLVESGTFNNGTADVTISNFYMGKYEVTQAEYEAVMNTNPSNFSGSDKPVEKVTWYNAVEYCNARSIQEGLTPCYDTSDWSCDISANGYRLPTEMEWMFAAKGGNEELATGYNQYAGTNVEGDLTNYAWYSSNNGSYGTALYGSKEVGTKLPNQLGLYDMSGNVWEWCNDWYGSYSSNAQTDPVGPNSGSGRVIRGGGWNYSATYCRVAFRYNYNPSNSRNLIGFRVARSSN